MYVIDGRQRLETIKRFKSEEKTARFKTFNNKTKGWREREKLSGAASKYYQKLPERWKNILDTTAVPTRMFVNIERPRLYEIFRRYNEGAEKLRPAEIRNAVFQASALHHMMFQLGGESDTSSIMDWEEKDVSRKLRDIMQNKTARYGAYDFIGRYFAFAYMSTGSVSRATNEFIERYDLGKIPALDGVGVDDLRREFVNVFNTTLRWYENPLAQVKDDGKVVFHGFLATLQMISTKRMLELIASGRTTEQTVREVIAGAWPAFSEDTLLQKQNSSTFWGRQEMWIEQLKGKCTDPALNRP